ncbi:MAG: hypothetical protein LBL78_00300 [Prevotellaceae bacterium]|jgi:hypothetical protein|nr:hypothetical protein [Prevotellaceae bacterium]
MEKEYCIRNWEGGVELCIPFITMKPPHKSNGYYVFRIACNNIELPEIRLSQDLEDDAFKEDLNEQTRSRIATYLNKLALEIKNKDIPQQISINNKGEAISYWENNNIFPFIYQTFRNSNTFNLRDNIQYNRDVAPPVEKSFSIPFNMQDHDFIRELYCTSHHFIAERLESIALWVSQGVKVLGHVEMRNNN